MPHASLKITGGVLVNETPALNEAGISACNLIRLKPDPKGLSIPEKLGGWSRFYADAVTNGPIRALNGYQDTNTDKWIVYGTDNSTAAQLAAIQCFTDPVTGLTTASPYGNYFHDLTPRYQSDSVVAAFQTTSASALVKVTDDTVSGVTQYDSVFLTTPVSVGGIVLSGLYSLVTLTGDQYEINAINILGASQPAAYSTVSAALAVTSGSFSAGVTTGTITLNWSTPNYTFVVGQAAVVNGIVPSTWNGAYIVTGSTATSVTLAVYVNSLGAYVSGGSITNYGTVPLFLTTNASPNITCIFPNHGYAVGQNFTIINETLVNGVTLYGAYQIATVPNAYTFTFTGPASASSTGQQFQGAANVVGGSADGAHVTLTLGGVTYVTPSIVPTGGSGNATNVTLTWTSPAYTFNTGSTIVVSGMNPSAWNGTYVVVSSTSTSVTYANVSVASYVSSGKVDNALYDIGGYINVSGVLPADWNGIYAVTGTTDTTVTYANTSANLTWVNGGSVADNGGDVAYIYSIGVGPVPQGSGYGVGGYGVGGYGSGQVTTPLVGATIPANSWDIANWGNVTIAVPYGNDPIRYTDGVIPFQPLYYWDPTVMQVLAQAVYTAPTASNGAFVAMPQRQVVLWGTTFTGIIDPLLVAWSDVNNYFTWIPQVTNQAGSYRIPSGSEIRGAMQTPQQGILWTDIELWSMVYISQPYIYSFNKIGQGCGLIAKKAKAMGSLNGVVYWMGVSQFFSLTNQGVQPIPCPIWDVIFQQLDFANAWKIVCAPNSLFQEIAWYYPVAGGSGENTNYVKYNALSGEWDYGVLGRSAWTDVSVLGQPIGADPAAHLIFQHEISPDADGAAIDAWFETGWFAIAEGDYKVFVDQCWPDFKYADYGAHPAQPAAQVQLTFTLAGYPDAGTYSYGPYTVTQGTTYISPRMRGRLMKIKARSTDLGSFWRLGAIRYRLQQDGRF